MNLDADLSNAHLRARLFTQIPLRLCAKTSLISPIRHLPYDTYGR